jgi:hypothetical protein
MELTLHSTSLTGCDAGIWIGPDAHLKNIKYSCCRQNLTYGLRIENTKMWVLSGGADGS